MMAAAMAAARADLADAKTDGPQLVWVGRTDLRNIMLPAERREHPRPVWGDLYAEAVGGGFSTRTWVRWPDGRLRPETAPTPDPAPQPIDIY